MQDSSDTSTSHPAALSKRMFALCYDLFILTALSMAYSALVTLAIAAFSPTTGDYLPMHSGPWFGLGWLATMVGFYWFFFKRAGQTVGMRAWRLRVVSIDSATLSHQQCLIRLCVAPVSLAAGGFGYFWCLLRRDKRSWHDLASGTQVIYQPKAAKQ